MYWIFILKPLFAVQAIDTVNGDYYQHEIYDYNVKPRLDWCTIILRVLMGGRGSRNNPFDDNFMDPNVVISPITIFLENVYTPPGLCPLSGVSIPISVV